MISHCGGGNSKNQMKKADKSLASIALLIGKMRGKLQGQVTVKRLRNGKGRPVWGGRTGDFGKVELIPFLVANARRIRKRLTSFIYLKTE